MALKPKKTDVRNVRNESDFRTTVSNLLSEVPLDADGLRIYFVTSDLNLAGTTAKMEFNGVLYDVIYKWSNVDRLVGSVWIEYKVRENMEELFSNLL